METGIAFAALDYDTGERFVRLRQQLGVTKVRAAPDHLGAW